MNGDQKNQTPMLPAPQKSMWVWIGVGVVVVIALAVAGYYYFFSESAPVYTPSVRSPKASAPVATQAEEREVTSLENDLKATTVEGLDSDLKSIDAELVQ